MKNNIKFIPSGAMKIHVSREQANFLCSKRTIEENCKGNDILAFDIYSDQKIIGFAMLRKFEEGGYFLWNYAIDEKLQGKGLGKRALSELISWMKTKNHLTTMTTTYVQGNLQAKNLYASLGFSEVEIIDEEDCQEVNLELRV